MPPVEGLQLDLATVVGRLRQLRDERAVLYQGNATVFERLLTCDLPRLEKYLTPEAKELLRDAAS